jgi:hypothetical protein
MQGETGHRKREPKYAQQIFKIYEIELTPILIHLLPFSSIEGEVVDTGVDSSLEKQKRSDIPKP